jgi:YVTN family beta-propeller protein
MASGGHMALALPGTTNILVTQGQRGIARIVDAATDTVLADIPVGENPDAAVYDPYSKLVFVMNHTSGEASVIDPIAMKSLATISVGGTLEFAVTNGTGKIFVNVEDQNLIAVIDVATRTVSARYDMPGCEEPTGLAYDTPTNLLISSCEGLAKVLDAGTGKEVASLAIADGADAVIYDGGRRVVYIPCGQSGELDVISLEDPSHISVVQRLPTAAGSRTGIVDTDTGRVYMLSSKPDPASPPGVRPGRLAGSYEVLVAGP